MFVRAGDRRRSSLGVEIAERDAKIEYDAELDVFRGEILGLAGGADFFGKNPKELRAEFSKFNLRISPDLHEKLAIVARAEGKSINTLAQEALQQRVAA